MCSTLKDRVNAELLSFIPTSDYVPRKGVSTVTNSTLAHTYLPLMRFSTTAAAAILFATLSYGQTSTSKTPGANPEFPAAGAPANAPTLQEQVTKTPGSSANPEFPTAGAPANAPSLQEQQNKASGSSANPEFPAAGAPLRDKKD
jgi:hypothetical protein